MRHRRRRPMSNWMERPVRCLACSCRYDAGPSSDGLPTPCPRRYLSPHTEVFMGLVARALHEAQTAEEPSRAQHEAAIHAARAGYGEPCKSPHPTS